MRNMKRKLRGMARSDMAHMIMCMLSGINEMKSQKLSCAVCAWGKSRSGSAFAAWMMGYPEDWTLSPFRDGGEKV